MKERGGGGGGDELVIGVRGNPRAFLINETLVCVDSPIFKIFLLLFFFFWLAVVASAWIYLST